MTDPHGAEAVVHAAMKADAMLEKGDLDGYAVWKRILRAVEELQGTVPQRPAMSRPTGFSPTLFSGTMRAK